MVIIIIGESGSGKTMLANALKECIIKPSYPEIVEGVPAKKPKGLKVENKIYCAQFEKNLPSWCYKSPYVLILNRVIKAKCDDPRFAHFYVSQNK